VTVWVPQSVRLHYPIKILIGLFALEQDSEIDLNVEFGLAPWSGKPSEEDEAVGTVYWTVHQGFESVRVAVDLQDQGWLFNRSALRACDVYLKRGFEAEALATLPTSWASRVKPLGLVYPCQSLGVSAKLLPRWLLQRAPQGLTDRSQFTQLKQELKLLVQLPLVTDFQRTPEEPALEGVIFQTRLWEQGESGAEDLLEVNATRSALVRGLRTALGPRFRGGLVPTRLARERYPDLVATDHYRRRDYVRMSGSYLIGVYSRGLNHSNAFKLGEYLAASQCIVAEPFRQELLQPLVADINYLPFNSVDECIEACVRLLADKPFAAAMRRANFEYFRAQVEPKAHAARLLSEAFNRPPPSG
jgi:hypothetical protein